MKPLVVELVQMLLKKGETVKMISMFDGYQQSGHITGMSFISSASGHRYSYDISCMFVDEATNERLLRVENREVEVLERMFLRKVRDFWVLF